jgi:hypothetical protein
MKAKRSKKVFAVCRQVNPEEVTRLGRKQPNWNLTFFAACSTMDIAQRQVDKLTARFGPTFIIIDAPLDP